MAIISEIEATKLVLRIFDKFAFEHDWSGVSTPAKPLLLRR